MQFFEDNRIDQEYTISDDRIKGKFVAWQNNNPDMRDNWPLERQAGAFLMTLGTIDEKDYKPFMELVKGE